MMLDTPFDRHEDYVDVQGEEVPALEPLGQDRGAAVTPLAESRPRLRRPLLAAGLAIAAGAGWWLVDGSTPAPAATPVPVVTVAAPLQQQITEWDEFVGRFKASKSVEVRPQVSGQIVQVHFTDGQLVQAGAPLFSIDARAFRAAYAQAQAEVARAASALALAQGNLSRAQRLISEDAVAATEIDRLRAEVRNGQAVLAAARAVQQARSIDLGFTTIRAPISGRISDRRIDAGNLVSGGGGAAATLLTTINAVDPLYFEFTGSEALYLKARREGVQNGAAVEIRLADETGYRWHGRLDFTDNNLDPASGTIRARAVVTNDGGLLAPGLFGRMRLASGGTRKALLVPDTAITTDQTAKQVLVVSTDGTVAPRSVELGPQVGSLRVVEKGLAPGDRVVIQGVQMAVPGKKVRALSGAIKAGAATLAQADRPAASTPRAASATLAN